MTDKIEGCGDCSSAWADECMSTVPCAARPHVGLHRAPVFTPEQEAVLRTIVAEMIGQALRGFDERARRAARLPEPKLEPFYGP